MKHTMIVLTLFLMITSTWAGTLTDDFNDGNMDGWRKSKHAFFDQSAQWSVEKGELVCTSQNVCGAASVLCISENTQGINPIAWRDYKFECQFKLEQAFPVGCANWGSLIGFGIYIDDTQGNGIDFAVRTDWAANNIWNQFFCEKFFLGVWENLGRGIFITDQEKWYTAKILANGNKYEMFIDDILICNPKIGLPDKGSAFIFARNCEVHFDNIVITGDNIPDFDMSSQSVSPKAVSPQGKVANIWGKIKNSH